MKSASSRNSRGALRLSTNWLRLPACRTGPCASLLTRWSRCGWRSARTESIENGPAAQAFLAGIGPMDMRPFVRFWDRLSYPRWTRLAESVRAGKGPFGELSFTKEEQEIFSKGVEGFTVGGAMGLTANYHFHGHERILDLGGGTGVFLTVLLGQVMGLQGTLFELPAAAAVARPIIAASPVADRIKVVDGDFFKGPIPDGHDAVILANVIHLFESQPNIELLRRLRPQVQIGARLLIVDFWTDPTHTQPVLAALMAGEFLIQAGQGDVYSDDDAKEWFAKTGWKFVEKKPLAGAQSLVVAEAV
jgi:ubiquinone/menaquinone biosynthesis C-methylase UbiE